MPLSEGLTEIVVVSEGRRGKEVPEYNQRGYRVGRAMDHVTMQGHLVLRVLLELSEYVQWCCKASAPIFDRSSSTKQST